MNKNAEEKEKQKSHMMGNDKKKFCKFKLLGVKPKKPCLSFAHHSASVSKIL